MKKLLVWYALFTKRLMKRPVFPILIALIPLSVLALTLLAGSGGGVRVAVVTELDSPAARRLREHESFIELIEYASEDEAREAVAAAEVDAAWIFRAEGAEEIEKFARGKHIRGVVTAVEREDTVFLKLAREQLAAAIYPEVSFALFSDHLVTEKGADPGELRDFYSLISYAPIIAFETLDGAPAEKNLLVMPVRGLISVLLALCALSSALYWYGDRRSGVFDRVSGAAGRLLPFFSHFCTLVPAAAASLTALAFTGGFGGILRESGSMLLYVLALCAFSELWRRLCRGEELLGAAVPAILTALLALAPVFAELSAPEWLSLFVPNALYLREPLLLLPYTAITALTAFFLPE